MCVFSGCERREEADTGIRFLSTGRRFAFHGSLDSVGVHRHAADAVVVGLSERFRVRHTREALAWTRMAVIPVGFDHSLDIGREPLAVFYLPFGRNFSDLAVHHPDHVVDAWVECGRALGAGRLEGFAETTVWRRDSQIDREAEST
jgi:hypothetical protein